MVKCDQESEEGDDDIEVIGENSHESLILLNIGDLWYIREMGPGAAVVGMRIEINTGYSHCG